MHYNTVRNIRPLINVGENTVLFMASEPESPRDGATRSRGIWLELEPSLWSGSGPTLIICLIIHENYMELTII